MLSSVASNLQTSLPSVEIFVLSGIIVALALLQAWRVTRPTASDGLLKPPVITARVPLIGHAFNAMRQGPVHYFSVLCSLQQNCISSLQILGQTVHLLQPSQSKEWVKVPNLGVVTAFRMANERALGMIPITRELMMEPDKGLFKGLSKLFVEEFVALPSLREYASEVNRLLQRCYEAVPVNQEVKANLGDWVFDALSGSLGLVFWGEDGMFSEPDFRHHLRIFFRNLHMLNWPFTFLIPRDVRDARTFVRARLSRNSQGTVKISSTDRPMLSTKISQLLAKFEIPTDGHVDYELSLIAGLTQNISNIVTWVLLHLLEDAELRATIFAEVAELIEGETTNPTADLGRVHECCPNLLATWFEILRLRGDFPIGRYVHRDTIFASKYQLKEGALLISPLKLSHLNPSIWGEDVESFRPSRFLSDDGRLNVQKTKQLKVFGLPGLQCPGRYLAFTLTMATLIRIFLTFDIEPVQKEGFRTPKPRNALSLGLAEPVNDPEVILVRQQGVGSVTILYENVRQGW